MPTTATGPMTITFPDDLASFVREEVASGKYSSADAVVFDILHDHFSPTGSNGRSNPTDADSVRRLQAMKDDPSQGLTHKDFWSTVESQQFEADALPDDPGLEHWLQTVGAARYDAYDADPQDVLTLHELKTAFSERRHSEQ